MEVNPHTGQVVIGHMVIGQGATLYLSRRLPWLPANAQARGFLNQSGKNAARRAVQHSKVELTCDGLCASRWQGPEQVHYETQYRAAKQKVAQMDC